MKKYLLLTLPLSVIVSFAYCQAPAWEGIYYGVGTETNLNHNTGKFAHYDNPPLKFTAQSPTTLKVEFLTNNYVHTIPNAVMGSKHFSGRVINANGVFVVKGKFVGKGRKMKGKYYWSSNAMWTECTFSASKL